LLQAFYDAYREKFGRYLTDVNVEALSWRLRARCESRTMHTPSRGPSRTRTARPKGHRRAYFPEAGRFVTVPVYDHYILEPGMSINGPAIVEQRESTAVVGSGERLTVDPRQNLLLSMGAPRR
jgi:N-methylhydantoinase A